MATIIENGTPASSRNVYMSGEDSSSAWAVVVLVLVVAIIAGAIWYTRYYRAAAVSPSTVQVNLPTSGYQPSQSSGTTNTTGSTQTTQTSGSASMSGSATTPSPTTPQAQ